MKDYSQKHEHGKTGLLGSAEKVEKTDARIAALGDIDELNSFLGLAETLCKSGEVKNELRRLQGEMFRAGAQMAGSEGKKIGEEGVKGLEGKITGGSAGLGKVSRFIYPSVSAGGAALHVCRSIARRAERSVLRASGSEELNAYFNRLSDYLFVLARIENKFCGEKEEEWKG